MKSTTAQKIKDIISNYAADLVRGYSQKIIELQDEIKGVRRQIIKTTECTDKFELEVKTDIDKMIKCLHDVEYVEGYNVLYSDYKLTVKEKSMKDHLTEPFWSARYDIGGVAEFKNVIFTSLFGWPSLKFGFNIDTSDISTTINFQIKRNFNKAFEQKLKSLNFNELKVIVEYLYKHHKLSKYKDFEDAIVFADDELYFLRNSNWQEGTVKNLGWGETCPVEKIKEIIMKQLTKIF